MQESLLQNTANNMLQVFADNTVLSRETLVQKIRTSIYPQAILLSGRALSGKGAIAMYFANRFHYETLSAGGLKRAFVQEKTMDKILGMTEEQLKGEFVDYASGFDWRIIRQPCSDADIALFNNHLAGLPAAARAVDAALDIKLTLALTNQYPSPIILEGRVLGGINAIHRVLARPGISPPFYSVWISCSPEEQRARIEKRLRKNKEFTPEAVEKQLSRDKADWDRLKAFYGVNFQDKRLYHPIDTTGMRPEQVAKSISDGFDKFLALKGYIELGPH